MAVPFQIHGEPADHDRQDANHTHGVQCQASKFSFAVTMNCEEDEIATNGDTETDQDEHGTISQLIRDKGD